MKNYPTVRMLRKWFNSESHELDESLISSLLAVARYVQPFIRTLSKSELFKYSSKLHLLCKERARVQKIDQICLEFSISTLLHSSMEDNENFDTTLKKAKAERGK